MNCPNCAVGTIRVITIAVCMCGHHSFICDGCYQGFSVPCGPETGLAALPPALPLTASDDLKESHAGLTRQLAEDKMVIEGRPDTYEELMRKMLAEHPKDFPPLEEFRKSLLTENAP